MNSSIDIAYNFLLAFHSNYFLILYRFRIIVSYWSIIANFHVLAVLNLRTASKP